MDTRKLSSRAIPTDMPGNLPAKQQTGRTDSAARSDQVEKSSKLRGSVAEVSARAGDPGVGVNVSPRAREIAESHKKAFEIAKSTPAVREDRVAELKRQIQAGTYNPDPARIADGIAREALFEYLASPEGKGRV